jgi:hypothetical protein
MLTLGKYKISFAYVGSTNGETWSKHNKEATWVKTICVVCRDNVRGLSVGEAVCKPPDNFCKATGRKIALKRAIAFASRSERREIWQNYFRVCNK